MCCSSVLNLSRYLLASVECFSRYNHEAPKVEVRIKFEKNLKVLTSETSHRLSFHTKKPAGCCSLRGLISAFMRRYGCIYLFFLLRKLGKIIILPRQFNHLGVFIRRKLMPEQS